MARNTSAAYKQSIRGVRELCAKIIIMYADGATDTLTDLADFMKLKFIDECSSANEFEIGSAIINEAVIVLNNRDGKFDSKDFYGARITGYAGIKVNDLPELLKMGTYIVDEPVSPGISISLTAYDNMIWLDKPYVPGILYPATLAQIAEDACTQCGVVLAGRDFPRADYIVSAPPEKECTCREIMAAVAQLAGSFVRADADGRIGIKWYADTVSHTIDILRSRTICTDNVTVTGINVYAGSDVAAQAGADGYRLSIKDNLLLESGKEQETADYLAGKLVGLTFRPLSVTCKSDMSIEAGDKVTVVDEKGKQYTTFVTSTTFAALEAQTVACNAASPTVNSSRRLSETAKAVIESKRYTQEAVSTERTAREAALQNLANRFATSSGMYITEERQEDGSVIYYSHDKPLLEESKYIWKFTIEAIGISIDGGQSYPYILDVSGTAILDRIYAVGIDADYITTGAFVVRDSAGNVVFSADKDTGQVLIAALTEFRNELGEYLRIDPEEGSISLGSSKSPVVLKIINNRIAFTQSGQEIAWFSDNQLHIRQLIVTELANLCGLKVTKSGRHIRIG